MEWRRLPGERTHHRRRAGRGKHWRHSLVRWHRDSVRALPWSREPRRSGRSAKREARTRTTEREFEEKLPARSAWTVVPSCAAGGACSGPARAVKGYTAGRSGAELAARRAASGPRARAESVCQWRGLSCTLLYSGEVCPSETRESNKFIDVVARGPPRYEVRTVGLRGCGTTCQVVLVGCACAFGSVVAPGPRPACRATDSDRRRGCRVKAGKSADHFSAS